MCLTCTWKAQETNEQKSLLVLTCNWQVGIGMSAHRKMHKGLWVQSSSVKARMRNMAVLMPFQLTSQLQLVQRNAHSCVAYDCSWWDLQQFIRLSSTLPC